LSGFINFLKTTALGGLLVIVPIAIVLFVLGQLMLALLSLANEALAWLGIGMNDALLMSVLALLALVGLCFVTGLAVRTRAGDALKRWFGRNVARRIPMYGAISSLTRRFAGIDGEQFSPVEVDIYGSGARAMGFLVESLPDGRCTVFVPTAPVATVGNLFVVTTDKVQRIDASVADTISVITQWGVDAAGLYGGESGGESAENAATGPVRQPVDQD